ncbi:MAG: septum formation initiator family protein [Prevotella sp.]|nr:septum formation initiator family protein [Prevotella sp.]
MKTNRFNSVWNFLGRFKYIIVIVLGVALVGFIDENSFIKRIEYDYQIKDLKAEISKYDEIYKRDSLRVAELQSSPKAISKIARERYFMKADDEDIYVLSTDEQPTTDDN